MKKTSKHTQKLTCFCLHSGFWCFCLSVPVRLSITTASSMVSQPLQTGIGKGFLGKGAKVLTDSKTERNAFEAVCRGRCTSAAPPSPSPLQCNCLYPSSYPSL